MLREVANGITPGTDHTIYQFIDQDKVILDRLLVNFSKVRFGDRDETVAVLEYESGIGVGPGHVLGSRRCIKELSDLLGDSDDIKIIDTNVKKARRA